MMEWGLGDKGEMSEPDERNWGRGGERACASTGESTWVLYLDTVLRWVLVGS